MMYSCLNVNLKISENTIDILKKFEQKNNMEEAGGILLGHVYPNYITIEKVTTPSILDKLGRYFFIRSKLSAQKFINKCWSDTDGTLIYLGEWHTHPITNPLPSDQDKKMISKCLKETKMEIDFLFLVIVGLRGSLWVGLQTRNGLIKMMNNY